MLVYTYTMKFAHLGHAMASLRVSGRTTMVGRSLVVRTCSAALAAARTLVAPATGARLVGVSCTGAPGCRPHPPTRRRHETSLRI